MKLNKSECIVFAAIIVIAGAIIAYAIQTTSIDISFGGIKMFVNGENITPKDANGNTVEPFIYKGTTYVPVRAVAKSLNKAVEWDDKNKSVCNYSVPSNI